MYFTNFVSDAFWRIPSLCVYYLECYDMDFVKDIIWCECLIMGGFAATIT